MQLPYERNTEKIERKQNKISEETTNKKKKRNREKERRTTYENMQLLYEIYNKKG